MSGPQNVRWIISRNKQTFSQIIHLLCFSLELPWVDAADHVLSEELWGCMARSCCFGQQQDNQSSHLKIVLAVIDEASAKRRQQIIELDSHDVGVKYNHNRREIIKEKYINSYQIIKMYVLTLTSCINQFSIDVLLSEFATCLAHFYIHQLHRSSVFFFVENMFFMAAFRVRYLFFWLYAYFQRRLWGRVLSVCPSFHGFDIFPTTGMFPLNVCSGWGNAS